MLFSVAILVHIPALMCWDDQRTFLEQAGPSLDRLCCARSYRAVGEAT